TLGKKERAGTGEGLNGGRGAFPLVSKNANEPLPRGPFLLTAQAPFRREQHEVVARPRLVTHDAAQLEGVALSCQRDAALGCAGQQALGAERLRRGALLEPCSQQDL